MNYNIIAKGYEELYKEEQLAKMQVIAQHLSVKKEDVLLDIGCGTGISTNYFDCQAIGIDPCKEMIECGSGDLRIGIGEELPFANDSFDVILCVSAIHNFDDYEKGLIEMKRLLKPQGKFAITLLKKAQKYDDIKEKIVSLFDVLEVDEAKDTVFVTKPI